MKNNVPKRRTFEDIASRDTPRAISLFSGCGGLDAGIHAAGFEVILANDLDERCAKSFTANFQSTPFYLGSVSDLKPKLLSDLTSGRVKEGVDLVFGGPPCPPFSKSRFYRKEKPRALDDPIGSETIAGFMDVIQRVKPRAFLMENVPGFSYKVHRDALEYVEVRAKRLGFTTRWRVLDAAEYGVPQHRQRFFMVGLRGRAFEFPEPTHGDLIEPDLFSAKLKPWATAGAALDDLDTEENASHEGHFAGGAVHDLLCQVPPGDNYLFFTKERGHPTPRFKWRSRYWSYLLKLSREKPSWTIQARRSNNMGPFHWRNRILRISEVKRLQSFPDDWVLTGTVEQQWRQVGNAVPPKLAQALGMQIKRFLDEERADGA
jgi:DNA (cytosine-5)-methyltransferase 1